MTIWGDTSRMMTDIVRLYVQVEPPYGVWQDNCGIPVWEHIDMINPLWWGGILSTWEVPKFARVAIAGKEET